MNLYFYAYGGSEMDLSMDGYLFIYIILPILIFISRIIDVSFGTLRIIFVARGKKYIAPILGFFEVFIWIVVISNIMKNANNLICYLSYAGGFAAGNFIGIKIEEKLAMGTLAARIFVAKEKTEELMNCLCKDGFGVTLVKGMGKVSEINILFCIFRRKEQNKVVQCIESIDAKIFYSIEEMKFVNHGIFLPRISKKK